LDFWDENTRKIHDDILLLDIMHPTDKKVWQCYVQVTTLIPLPLSEVTTLFNRNLFEYLAPVLPKLTILQYDGQKKGDLLFLQLGIGPIHLPWNLTILDAWDTPTRWGFIDQGTRLPFPLTAWQHEHSLVAVSAHETLIEDKIHFRAGPKWLTLLLKPLVKQMFLARRKPYLHYFCGTK
jgi:ligand-binding SRPBCC domain-containing protein